MKQNLGCSRTKDLSKIKFDRLKVISFAGRDKSGRALWNCECKCGNTKVALAKLLMNGECGSCGCLREEQKKKFVEDSTLHGDRKLSNNSNSSLFYKIWNSMKQRCDNVKDKRYDDYGRRGITYDSSWSDYLRFKEDMYSSYCGAVKIFGVKSHVSIERLNVNKGYSSDNCTWIPRNRQVRNKRDNRLFKAISPDGKEYMSKIQTQFAKDHELSQSSINLCLNEKKETYKGWTFSYVQLKKKPLISLKG